MPENDDRFDASPFLPICERLAEVEDNPPAPLDPAQYSLIKQEGKQAVQSYPPRMSGLLSFRPFGINPYELFSSEYNAWNDGYEEEASRFLCETLYTYKRGAI